MNTPDINSSSTELNKSPISLLDLLIVFASKKKVILINFLIIAVVAVGISLILKKQFRSEVVFFPKGHSGSSLAALVGAGFGEDLLEGVTLGKRQYIELLQSRELRERVIEEFDLVRVYKMKKTFPVNYLDKTLEKLQKTLTIDVSEEGGLGITDVLSIKIVASDEDPQLAADMANYLYALLKSRVTEYNKQEYAGIISFVEKQIDMNNISLIKAREGLTKFQQTYEIYDLPAQVSSQLELVVQYNLEIVRLDYQINYLTKLYSSGHAEIKELRIKKRELQRVVKELKNNNIIADKSDSAFSLKNGFNLTYEYYDLFADVEVYSRLSALLTQQLLQAKLKAEKEFAGTYLVDSARAAQWKYKPKKAFVILGIVFSWMLLVFAYISLKFFIEQRMEKDSQSKEKISLLWEKLKK